MKALLSIVFVFVVATTSVHALGEADSQRIVSLLTVRVESARSECVDLFDQLEKVEDQLADLRLLK